MLKVIRGVRLDNLKVFRTPGSEDKVLKVSFFFSIYKSQGQLNRGVLEQVLNILNLKKLI